MDEEEREEERVETEEECKLYYILLSIDIIHIYILLNIFHYYLVDQYVQLV